MQRTVITHYLHLPKVAPFLCMLSSLFCTLGLPAQDSPPLTSNPSGYHFSPQAINTTSTTSLTLSNVTDNALSLTEVSLAGAQAVEFSTNLTSGIQIPAQSQQVVEIQFTPQNDAPNIRNAMLVIHHTGPASPLQIMLSGEAVDSSLSPGAISLNAGGPAQFLNGRIWLEDQYFEGGLTFNRGNPIENTQDDAIYQTHRFGQMAYHIPVGMISADSFEVELNFAELFYADSGKRVFGVILEEDTVIHSIDLVNAAGPNTAWVRRFPVPIPADDTISIEFIKIVEAPIINGIQVVPQGASATTNQAPVANFGYEWIRPSQSIALDASPSLDIDGNIEAYRWDLGDGSNKNGKRITHTYDSPGIYAITLTTTDDAGGMDTHRDTIEVQSFVDTTAIFINSGGPTAIVDGFFWEKDQYQSGGGIFKRENPIANTEADEIFQVHVFGNTRYHIPVASLDADSIKVELLFAELFHTEVRKRVFGIVLNGTQVTDSVDIVGSVGPDAALMLEYTLATPNDDTLRLSFSPMIEAPIINGIKIHPLSASPPIDNRAPTARFSVETDDDGFTFHFDARNSTDPEGDLRGFTWDFGNGITDTGRVVSHTYPTGGTFTVMLTVTDGEGLSHSVSQEVEAVSPNQPPIAEFTFEKDSLLFYTVHFDASPSRDPDGTLESYQWDFGNGIPVAGMQVSHTFPHEGPFLVQLVVTDNQGATDTTSQSIEPNAPNELPVAAFNIRAGEAAMSVVLNASNSQDPDGNITQYRWKLGDGNEAVGEQVVHIYDKVSAYVVKLVVMDDAGGKDSLQLGVNIPEPDSLPNSIRINAGGSALTLNGSHWREDQFSGSGTRYAFPAEITNTLMDELYASAHSGEAMYKIPLQEIPAEQYVVSLYFTETEGLLPGERVFDVWINDSLHLSQYDIAADGGRNRERIKSIAFSRPATDTLSIQLSAQVGTPIIHAIRVWGKTSTSQLPRLATEAANFHPYPNPSEVGGTLHINLGNSPARYRLTLLTPQGQVVLKTSWRENTSNSDISLKLPPHAEGLYYLLMETPKGEPITSPLFIRR